MLPTWTIVLLGLAPAAMAAAQQDVLAPRLVLPGPSAGTAFGYALGSVGDLDDDGVAELLIGAPRAGDQAGAVWVLSGADGHPLHALTGRRPRDQFGNALDGAGDVNGDGVPDLLIGSPSADFGAKDAGSATLISGRSGKPLRRFDGPSAFMFFGNDVSGLGDVDGDGHADVAVGCLQDGLDNVPQTGTVRVFSGKSGALLHRLAGEARYDSFGYALAGPGDLDGDGAADVVAGAHLSERPGPDGGSLFALSGRSGQPLWRRDGNQAGDRFGSVTDALGDVDLDGVPDLVVGAPGMDGDPGGDFAGCVLVLSGADGSVLWRAFGRRPGDEFGYAVVGLGDVDADGTPDVAATAWAEFNGGPGEALLLSGASGAVLLRRGADQAGSGYGAALASLGDTDGDGRADWAVSAPSHVLNRRRTGAVMVFGGFDR